MVCLGNICRSPMAEVVLAARIAEAGLADRVEVDQLRHGHLAPRGGDGRAGRDTLTAAGYDAKPARRAEVRPGLAGRPRPRARHGRLQPRRHPRDRRRPDRADPDRVRLFRDFDPDEPGGDVPDPYYGGDAGFEEVLTMVERTAAVIVAALREECASGSPTTGTTTP